MYDGPTKPDEQKSDAKPESKDKPEQKDSAGPSRPCAMTSSAWQDPFDRKKRWVSLDLDVSPYSGAKREGNQVSPA